MNQEELTPEVVSTLYEDTTGLRDSRFHWFSVNRPVNEKFFDFKLIDDPQTFVALCDPRQAGAPELDNRVKDDP
jgi:hypothetical protein